MDRAAVLEAFDEQVRRRPRAELYGGLVEREDDVIRVLSRPEVWNGVVWSALSPGTADAVIAAQITRFDEQCDEWEWKYYSHDEPADLPDRLVAAGFAPEPPEALMVATLAELALGDPPPYGITLREVTDAAGVRSMVAVQDEVFGHDNSALGDEVLAGLARTPPTIAAVVAWAAERPIGSGRVEFHEGTEFASIWGGGTLPQWRHRGVFRALVAHRAAAAADRGFRYLQVDAAPASRPILERLGFVELATTIPFKYRSRIRGQPG